MVLLILLLIVLLFACVPFIPFLLSIYQIYVIMRFMIVFTFLKIKNGKITVYLVCIYMGDCLVAVKH